MKPTKMIDIIIDDDVKPLLSEEQDIRQAVLMTCENAGFTCDDLELCIRFAGDDVVRELNHTWRDKDKVTDVLSFPMQENSEFDLQQPLGDIILAADFVTAEANRLAIPVQAHVLHLIVHGVLHLLGFDHINDADADSMQQHESHIMQRLDLHNPYPTLAL